MAPSYLIFRHEKVGILDLFRLLFTRRRLTEYGFVECSAETALELGDGTWIIGVVESIHKFLSSIRVPLSIFGCVYEFILNLLSLNGGLLGLLWRLLTVSVIIPRRGSKNFRSFIGHIDGRVDLYKGAHSLSSSFPLTHLQKDAPDINLLDLTMMAAKLAYENEAYIKEVVTHHWKMDFVQFFNCWNNFLPDANRATTQAFIFCDKASDPKVICLAFRGTATFDAEEWKTDFDFSSISMGGKMGSVHLGFMKALGLQDDKDFANGFPKDPPANTGDKPLAYYAIRQYLSALHANHPNAKIMVTGHSLGAALAALFPALLAFHGESGILNSIGVATYGQPRVGDEAFASFMDATLGDNYGRMVYRYDLAARVPPDVTWVDYLYFRHFGTCRYFSDWYQYEEVSEMPNKNYFYWKDYLRLYGYAWWDFFRAIFLGWTQGKDFAESWTSLVFRTVPVILIPILGPGIASHSPRDYLNAVRLSKRRVVKDMV